MAEPKAAEPKPAEEKVADPKAAEEKAPEPKAAAEPEAQAAGAAPDSGKTAGSAEKAPAVSAEHAATPHHGSKAPPRSRDVFKESAKRVRSLSQGRADPVMEPHAFAPAPDEVLRRKLHPEEFM